MVNLFQKIAEWLNLSFAKLNFTTLSQQIMKKLMPSLERRYLVTKSAGPMSHLLKIKFLFRAGLWKVIIVHEFFKNHCLGEMLKKTANYKGEI